MTLESRFFAKVEMDPNAGCWLWSGSTAPRGYGTIKVDGKVLRAHRLSWEMANGRSVGSGKEIMHRCDVPACVNPDHLREATHKENMADMSAKGRTNKRVGSQSGRAKINENDVLYIRQQVRLGHSQAGLARYFGMTPTSVNQIIRGKTWTHVKEAAI